MTAPRDPPPSLLNAYTLGNQVPLARLYVDEAQHVDYRSRITVSRSELEGCVKEARRHLLVAGHRPVLSGVSRGEVAAALSRAGVAAVENKEVIVFGATEPWVECICVAAGAKRVLTVEYQQLEYEHPKMSTITVANFAAAVRGGGRLAASFDIAIALSSFDHDGLGRYGERLHPNGDLLAMRSAWQALRPHSGRLLLSAPVGPDLVVWNLHRRYGTLRLPLLLAGWEEESRIGWDAARLTAVADHRRRFEPIFVLRRNSTEDLGLADVGLPHDRASCAAQDAGTGVVLVESSEGESGSPDSSVVTVEGGESGEGCYKQVS